MKFLATVAIMLGFVLNANAVGQSSNASITGKANVAAQVGVTAGTSLDFKNVTPGIVKTIGFTGNVLAGITTTGETSGHFTITKGTNTQVDLTFTTLPTALAGIAATATAGKTLPIVFTAQLSKGAATVHSISSPVQGTNVVVASASTTGPYYATDEFQLDLGGSVTPAGTQTAGDYESTITLTATYN